GVPTGSSPLRLRRRVDDGLDQERAAHRDLLELPSVLHRKTEAGRLSRPHRPIPAALREEGQEIMSLRSAWLGSAKLIIGTFNAVTNGLTSSMPAAADRNVDMLIGGQAVLEGVMMRSLTGYSVAVRQPNGGVAIRKDRLVSITKKYPFLKFPVIRGSVVLIQSLILGIRALNYSAGVVSETEEGKQEMSSAAVAGSMIMAALLGVGLFILAPLGITNLMRHYLMPQMTNFTYNVIDGLIRAICFFVYIISISFMNEIRLLFQ